MESIDTQKADNYTAEVSLTKSISEGRYLSRALNLPVHSGWTTSTRGQDSPWKSQSE